MIITLTFLATLIAFTLVAVVSYRWGIALFFFLHAVYPRFFSFGLGDEGFALTGQRAMIFVLFGLFLLRALWGSPDIRQGAEIFRRYKAVVLPLALFLAARFAGNMVTGRFDLGSAAALVSESVLSIFVVYMLANYVRNYRQFFVIVTMIVASLFFNQIVAVIEFATGGPIFPQDLDLQYEQARSEEELLAGKIRDDRYRSMGFFDSSNALGGLGVLVLPYLIAMFQTRLNLGRGILCVLVFLLLLPVAVFSGSRTALFFCLGILGWYVFHYIAAGLSKPGKLLLGAIFGILMAVMLFVLASGYIEQQLFGEGYRGSTLYRYLQYVYGMDALIQSPLFGYGFARNIGDIVNIRPLDSFYLRILLEGGIVALIAYLVALRRAYVLAGYGRSVANSLEAVVFLRATQILIVVSSVMAIVQSMPQTRVYVCAAIGLAIAILEIERRASESGVTPSAEFSAQ